MPKQNERYYSISGTMNLVLAIFLLFSPLWLRFTSVLSASANASIFGTFIAGASIAAIYRYDWLAGWASLACGVLVALSPWILRFHYMVWSATPLGLVIGLTVAAVAGMEQWTQHHSPHARPLKDAASPDDGARHQLGLGTSATPSPGVAIAGGNNAPRWIQPQS